jgi:hypothetical protein
MSLTFPTHQPPPPHCMHYHVSNLCNPPTSSSTWHALTCCATHIALHSYELYSARRSPEMDVPCLYSHPLFEGPQVRHWVGAPPILGAPPTSALPPHRSPTLDHPSPIRHPRPSDLRSSHGVDDDGRGSTTPRGGKPTMALGKTCVETQDRIGGD